MSIEDVLREMRGFADKDMVSVVCSDIMIEWADAIEAAMREPVAEVGYSWARSSVSHSILHAYPLSLLSDQHIPQGTKLFAFPPDAQAELLRITEQLAEREAQIQRLEALLSEVITGTQKVGTGLHTKIQAAIAGKPRD